MKAIAIVTPRTDTFSNPTLTFLIEKLIEKKYKILFFGYEQIFIPNEIREKLSIYELPFYFYRLKSYSFIKLLKQYYKVRRILRVKNKVSTLICVDPMGLVIAGRIKRLIDLKLIYISFEIFFEDEFFSIEKGKRILKKLEVKYSRNVNLIVVQDKKREQLLREVNNFNTHTRVMHIPVSPKPTEIPINNYDINEDLNIPRDKKIVVYSGTLDDWSGVNELINLFPEKWNSEYWLVIHTHYKIEGNDEFHEKLFRLNNNTNNITFHNKPFDDFKEYVKFLSRCHVGIATYFPNTVNIFAGKNMVEIGLSSGKFSTYMMLGIPTITTSNSIYMELNNKYHFGETIKTMNDIPSALNKIQNGYDKKVIACKSLYEDELNPISKMNNLISYIETSL